MRPDRVPDTSARALRPARRVIAGPDDFGAGFVRQRPFESDPDTWACRHRRAGCARSDTGGSRSPTSAVFESGSGSLTPGVGLFLRRVAKGRFRFLGDYKTATRP